MTKKVVGKKSKQSLNFEQALEELESLVDKMEAGDLSLEESLGHFERGIQLTRSCQKALKEAEQKVQKLLEKDGSHELSSFEREES